MSEMLGNQYFMARKYYDAELVLTKELQKQPENFTIRKKVVVCNTQTGKVWSALKHFLRIIKEDIDIIIKTTPEKDDCPCPQLVKNLEIAEQKNLSKIEVIIELGILWLYCDSQKSEEFFEKALTLKKDSDIIKETLNIIKNYNKKQQLIVN